jgi:hypothetical protein
MHHLLTDPTRRVESVHLPRSAQHASRIHCAVEVTATGVRIAVMGQNGVRVKQAGKGVRVKKGECREFEGTVEVDFYGCKVRLIPTLPRSPSPLPQTVEAAPEATLEPPPVDLPALLASTVVFSGSSKLSLPDLVKHMLEVSSTFTKLIIVTTKSERIWT